MPQNQEKKYKFKAEVHQLLDILTHSLYSHRDVFIRELISNAADALDKVRLMEMQGEKIADPDLDLGIHIRLDKEDRRFIIEDSGIGMTAEELKNNIGTIARSGTSDFIKKLSETEVSDVNLIGKFGVGFYSVFMAAEKVEVTSKSAYEPRQSWTWVSDGKSSFSITPGPPQAPRGTTITVSLREDAAVFAEDMRVKTAIKTYSNFVPFPIFLGDTRINTISAIWREPKSAVADKDYKEFYKFIAHQDEDPLTWIHFSADVPLQFHALLFVPKTNFEMLGFGQDEEGINLFVKRIMIDPHSRDLLPPYLRFLRGVVESDDLPLNISRETLQENPYMIKIRNTVVSKILTYLNDFAKEKKDDYAGFWAQHGRILKEGYNDFAYKDKIASLFRFKSSRGEKDTDLFSFDEYIERMPEKQEEIIYFSGSSRAALDKNPVMEIFKVKNIEVLYCFDPIDEFVLPGLLEYKGKKLISADQVDPEKFKDIPFIVDKKKPKTKVDEKDLEKLTRRIKNILGDQVEDVKLSDRLVDSPAVLVGKDRHLSSQMEKIMHLMNKDVKISPKILEVNRNHPFIHHLHDIYRKKPQDPLLTKLVKSLFSTVLLLDGTVDDPHEMADSIQQVLEETARLYTEQSQNDSEK